MVIELRRNGYKVISQNKELKKFASGLQRARPRKWTSNGGRQHIRLNMLEVSKILISHLKDLELSLPWQTRLYSHYL